jgi:hypothetical protein
MQESRPSLVLRQRVDKIGRKTSFDALTTDSHNSVPSFGAFIHSSLWLPLSL